MKAKKIFVNGTVQAVGFRPFVYRIARQCDLQGWVKNLGDAGVEIFVQGTESSLEEFPEKLRLENPPLASIEQIEENQASVEDSLDSFEIRKSFGGSEGSGTIPPDIATCEACLEDISGNGRYGGYWATSCVNCGPRFTVIRKLPYDRDKTSMDEFPMCEDCRAEYTDPLDRRHHAQTIACPECGPSLEYRAGEEGAEKEKIEDPIENAVLDLKRDEIVAIQGLGGCHLACNALKTGAVKTLRERLNRPGQPFALMGTEELADSVAQISEKEREILKSPRRPIVLLEESRRSAVSDSVNPGLDNLGLMLPYTGLHYLIFEKIDFPLVMTSANLPGQPMLKEPRRILEVLEGIVDGFLLHDREIVSRCDDSVVKVMDGESKFLRRSRGWVPESISVDLGERPLLALGAEQDNVIGLYREGKVYLSQYLGDTDDPESLDFLEEALRRLAELTGAEIPSRIAHDLHPSFLTTKKAEEMSGKDLPVQHHVAHLGSLLAEYGLDECLGIIMDGVGYGKDGDIWGGEIIEASGGEYNRRGGLSGAYMPGGDLATEFPERMILGILYPLVERGEMTDLEEFLGSKDLELSLSDGERSAVFSQLRGGLNTPGTTSTGRFLDAVSALLGICTHRNYEGEPAMKLEAAARGEEFHPFELPYTEEGKLDQSLILLHLIDMIGSLPAGEIAATAQWAIAEGMVRSAIAIADLEKYEFIGLSGGVANNGSISARIRKRVEEAGFEFVGNRKVPPGDGGIALGQLKVVGERIEGES